MGILNGQVEFVLNAENSSRQLKRKSAMITSIHFNKLEDVLEGGINWKMYNQQGDYCKNTHEMETLEKM